MRKIPVMLLAVLLAGCGSDSEDPAPATSNTRTEALSYAKDNLPCTTESDCCVVFDGCRANGLIVAASDKDKVASLLATAPMDMCLACIAPSVQVKCVASVCTGAELVQGAGSKIEDSEPFRKNHCGGLPLPTGWTEKQSAPSSPPGWSPAKVIGCGP